MLKRDETYGKQVVQCIRDAQAEFTALTQSALKTNYLPQSSVWSEKEIQFLINSFIGCKGIMVLMVLMLKNMRVQIADTDFKPSFCIQFCYKFPI